jgi:tetratricopeptide (TPR) repeat protein
MMREQLGFALNRQGRFDEAEKVLKAVINEFGPSSETNGLLGRIYKDRWESAKQQGHIEARALLKRAAETYLQGFEADWRDAYPGVNAVTLMEMMDRPDPMQAKILPVVRYAAAQEAKAKANYWAYATLLELAVLGRDQADGELQLSEALAVAGVSWHVESTARNLRLIRELRTARGEDAGWIEPLEAALIERSRKLAPQPG